MTRHKPRVDAHDLYFVPQCAAISVSIGALEAMIDVLLAAHPALADRQGLQLIAPPHVESVADICILQAGALIETLLRYQLLALNPPVDFRDDDPW